MVTSLLNPPDLKYRNRGEFHPDYDGISLTEPQIRSMRASAPHLNTILDAFGAFPRYSLVIGLGRDGLPYMLDLNNPKSGSILVVGETGCGKTRLLNVMGQSACLLNHTQDVSLCVISNKAYEYSNLMNYSHCQGLVAPYEREAGELVIELASIAEQRRSGRELGSPMMLIIDDFINFSQMLNDYSVYLNLKTLVSQGPKSGIWPIISVNPKDVRGEKGRFMRTFGTYIFERSSNQEQYSHPENATSNSRNGYLPDFDVIIGGSLHPIINLSV